MCGIAGILSFRDAPDRDLICSMIGRLSHRGPDSSGYYRDRWIALGHSRLSIIDTAGGAQPLANEDGTVWVSFNGEIFNYLELAAELRTLGHRFRTVSDTEVIVHAWEEWGPDAFERFNGQWALALLGISHASIDPQSRSTRRPTTLHFKSWIRHHLRVRGKGPVRAS